MFNAHINNISVISSGSGVFWGGFFRGGRTPTSTSCNLATDENWNQLKTRVCINRTLTDILKTIDHDWPGTSHHVQKSNLTHKYYIGNTTTRHQVHRKIKNLYNQCYNGYRLTTCTWYTEIYFMPVQGTVKTIDPQCWRWLENCCLRLKATVPKSSPAPRDNSFDCSLNRHEITVLLSYIHAQPQIHWRW